MTSLTVENYLKAMLQISLKHQQHWVTTGQLAAELDVSPGSVTSMLKTLSEANLAEYRPYGGVALTETGRALALRVLRRHRLIELFLVETLKLTWDQVHEEAEHMEHAVSDFLVERIDEFLGWPAADPHGDPIPASDGVMRGSEEAAMALAEIPAGGRFRISRVVNQDPAFLRFLTESGVEIGALGEVEQNSLEAGIVAIKLAGKKLNLGHSAAAHLQVVPCGQPTA
jgi:DtxR family Mn-dependent transcriptional regulator